ncbi:MAG: hypothetical protein RM022_014465 [Nostoc sp. EfeVER01]|uniref:hypothetical protein n=1 Tax=unclassified Nostoc TaxID=2593658 RepID=UPI002AD30270|nr:MULTISPECIES: hypothetical protein [unclassified Nostoc]MDZ7945416.1 hypothetical protein [Nostoc sp. EfeVER01]MDZ7993373.1 hypothetical protein [Nostoc sp. EspVER01]
MLVGKTITDETIKVTYKEELEKNPEKFYEYLAKEGVSQVSQGQFIEEAVKTVNGLKNNYGNGISTKICIFNATGQKLKKLHENSWHGRWYDGFDTAIWNGQCSAILHAHSSSGGRGSSGYLVYQIENVNLDVFIGWDTPYAFSKNKFIVEIREKDHWWNGTREKDMQDLVEHGWTSSIPNDNQKWATKFNYSDKSIECQGHVDGT